MDFTGARSPRSSTLREAYDRAAAIIGSRAESFEIAEEVERQRLAWQPSRVSVVMLAESHVWTSEENKPNSVRPSREAETGLAPSRFVRFVYCLDYEAPQYWTLFHDAMHEPTRTRITLSRDEKLHLLSEMKDAGIWLVDASVTALYRPRDGCLVKSESKYKNLLQGCWEAHVRYVMRYISSADCREGG